MIKSALLTAALEEAYANRQMKGKYPGCVLHIDVPFHMVDVNVHPAKTVVKFVNERSVFSAVHHSVMDALDAAAKPVQTAVPVKSPAQSISVTQPPRGDFYQTMDAKTFRERTAEKSGSDKVFPARAENKNQVVFRDSARAFTPVQPVFENQEQVKVHSLPPLTLENRAAEKK